MRGVASTPGAVVTSTPSPSVARRPSSGETVYGGYTVALPPPSVRATAALGPTSATRRRVDGSSGSTASLRASTNPAAATSRSSAATLASSYAGAGAGEEPSSAPTRPASRRIRTTLSSIAASSTSPARTAATSASPHGPIGPG